MYYGKADEKLEVGDMLAKYDGKWKRMMPSNPTASQTANPYQFYQERETESKLFQEGTTLVELSGDDSEERRFLLQKTDDPATNLTVAFVTVQTAYERSFASVYTKQYGAGARKAAFEFDVKTAMRSQTGAFGEPTELEIKDYEKKQSEKQDLAVLIALFGLAGVFGLVLLIFLYQALCGKHVENEYETRKQMYMKEDQ